MHGHSLDLFIQLVQAHRVLGYVVLFIAMIFEGEAFLVVAGILTTIKAFDVADVWVIAFVGIVLGNVLWYSLGTKIENTRFAKRAIGWGKGIIIFVFPKFKEKPFKSIFFSKFIYGANRATVVMSGVMGVPFRLFFKAEFLASVLWVTLYLGIGYFFGYAALSLTRNLSRLIFIVAVFVISFILIQKAIAYYYEQPKK